MDDRRRACGQTRKRRRHRNAPRAARRRPRRRTRRAPLNCNSTKVSFRIARPRGGSPTIREGAGEGKSKKSKVKAVGLLLLPFNFLPLPFSGRASATKDFPAGACMRIARHYLISGDALREEAITDA